MSKTDKTKPSHVRLREVGAEEYVWDNYGRTGRKKSVFDVPKDFKWSYAEQGVGPKEARWAKRMKAKKNRRREIPWREMRGHGWGQENLRYR